MRLKIKQSHINVTKTDIMYLLFALFYKLLITYYPRFILIFKSNSVWPFTAVVFKLWAIGKAGGSILGALINML